MVIQKLNEKGQIRRLGESPDFSFNYTSNFYGECTFTGRVECTWDRGLVLDKSSLELQHHLLKRGSQDGLIRSAEVFFNTALHKIGSVDEVDDAPVAGDTKKSRTAYSWQRLDDANSAVKS